MVQFFSQLVSLENTVAHSAEQSLRTHHTISRYKLSILACSQILYFLFKVRRAHMIKTKPQGIFLSRSRSRACLALAHAGRKRTKRKIKQRLCTGYSTLMWIHAVSLRLSSENLMK